MQTSISISSAHVLESNKLCDEGSSLAIICSIFAALNEHTAASTATASSALQLQVSQLQEASILREVQLPFTFG
jgi:hypothetical protein